MHKLKISKADMQTILPWVLIQETSQLRGENPLVSAAMRAE